ncbi:MAG: hypothetical protein GY778_03155 [bacterium]|nr:hypothetical protein [bacterium]
MPDDRARDQQRLQRFLGADFKHGVAPVPTGLDQQTVLRCLENEVTDTQVIGRMKRLVQLANYYDLNGATAVFTNLLNKKENKPDEYDRSALALIALAWIGDPGRRTEARHYYHTLLGWTPVDPHLHRMEEVCDAFGPDEGTDRLRVWLEKEVNAKRSDMAKQEQAGNDAAARGTRRNLLSLTEFVGTRIPRLDRINAIRTAIEGKAGRASRLPDLTEYYVDTSMKSWPELSYWCAMKLMRYAKADPSMRPRIAAEFMKRARAFDRHDNADRQYEFDINRARAMRAAVFFGQELGEQDRAWLDQQTDAGTDVLALRPDWAY